MVVFIAINFIQQLRRTESKTLAALATDISAIVGACYGKIERDDEPYLFSFDDRVAAHRLQAVEVAERVNLRIQRDGKKLHGWTVVVAPSLETADASYAHARRLWRSLEGDSAVFIAPECRQSLDRYLFEKPDGGCGMSLGRKYSVDERGPAIPRDGSARLLPVIEEKLSAFMGAADRPTCAVIGPEHSGKKEALRILVPQGGAKSATMELRGSYDDENPFAPVIEAIGEDLMAAAADHFEPDELAFWQSLIPAFRLVKDEGFRESFPKHITVGFRLFFAAALELYCRIRIENGLSAVVVCSDVQFYSDELVRLVCSILDMTTKHRDLKIVFSCAGRLPQALAQRTADTIEVDLPRKADIRDWFDAERLPAPTGIPERADMLACRWNVALARAAGEEAREDGGEGKLEPHEWLDRDEAAARLLAHLPLEASIFMYISSLGKRSLRGELFFRFMEMCGYSPLLFEMLRTMLASDGLSSPSYPYSPLTPRLGSEAERALGPMAKGLKESFMRHMATLLSTRALTPSLELWDKTRADLGESEYTLLLDAINMELAIGFPEAVAAHERSRESVSLSESTGFAIGNFDIAMAANDREGSIRHLEKLKSIKGSAPGIPQGIVKLCQASFAYAAGDPVSSQQFAKTALMDLHGKKTFRGEAKAHRLLGLSSLASGQFFDAMDYLSNGYDVAMGARESYEALVCAFNCGIAHFIYGNLSRAIRWFDSSLAEAIRLHRKDWEGLALFAKGRARFETGQYTMALAEFEALEKVCSIFGDPGLETRAELWTARTLIYTNSPESARDILERHADDPEALFFRAEEKFFARDPQEALELVRQAISKVQIIPFFSPETPHRESGFRSFEQRGIGTLSGTAFEIDIMRAFATFIESFVHQQRDYACEIHNMTREDKIANVHPYFHQYCLYSYLIVDAGAESSLDKLTALSKAFKSLQQRACRNDETAMKNSYLERNYWNRQIVAAAREHKFV